MADDVLIKAEGVSKKFCRSLKKSLWYGLKDIAGEVVGRNGNHDQLRPQEFWAVNDVSFELHRGECLGLIGRNGAGKTTLLKMLNGLIKPDRGRIEMHGRVGALIALGAGFNPILTGRENIYVNGSVLGLTKKEIDAKLKEIIDFADIDDFIDTPVQSYSSGMQVRLGFAIATTLEPDVLLLDEVIAVGDAGFRYKCYNKIVELMERSAVIFVSHDMSAIGRMCSKVSLLDQSRVIFQGKATEAIQRYYSLYNFERKVNENPGVRLKRFEVSANSVDGTYMIDRGDDLEFLIEVDSTLENQDVTLLLHWISPEGQFFSEWNSMSQEKVLKLTKGHNIYKIKLLSLSFNVGLYYFSFIMLGNYLFEHIIWHHYAWKFKVHGDYFGNAPHQIKGIITD